MAGLEDQLSAVLNNPQMMQQIMAMAQSFSPPPQESPPPPTAPPPTPEPSPPAFDPAMLQKLGKLLAGRGSGQPFCLFYRKFLRFFLHFIASSQNACYNNPCAINICAQIGVGAT